MLINCYNMQIRRPEENPLELSEKRYYNTATESKAMGHVTCKHTYYY